jgi:hypothetical protein
LQWTSVGLFHAWPSFGSQLQGFPSIIILSKGNSLSVSVTHWVYLRHSPYHN